MFSVLLTMALLSNPNNPKLMRPLVPTPQMRIDSVYQELERNRAPRIIPGTVPYPYPPLPSYPKPFENVYPYWYNPYPYNPYYRPYY